MAKFKIEDMASLVNGTLYEAAESVQDGNKCIVLAIQEFQKSVEDDLRCITDILRQIEINTYKENENDN